MSPPSPNVLKTSVKKDNPIVTTENVLMTSLNVPLDQSAQISTQFYAETTNVSKTSLPAKRSPAVQRIYHIDVDQETAELLNKIVQLKLLVQKKDH